MNQGAICEGVRNVDITVTRPSALDAAQSGAWRAFSQADPALASPYFALEFALACDRVRADTRVAVIASGGQVKGFLPFQRGPLGYCLPLGGPLSDFQGLIAEPGAAITLGEVLRAARINVLPFGFVPRAQSAFAGCFEHAEDSHYADLSRGFDAWHADRMATHKKSLKRYEAKARKLQRQAGALQFTLDDRNPEAFAQLLTWKSAQYRATGFFDVFSVPWTSALLHALWERQGEGFAGQLSTLYAGDHLVAAHFGMRTPRAAHYWFPAYDPDFASYGPGHTLLLKMIHAHADDGMQAVHLGTGNFRYKHQFGGAAVTLCSGTAMAPSFSALCRQGAKSVQKLFEALPLGPVSALPGRALRRLDRTMAFRAA